jgi:hypothetical protein
MQKSKKLSESQIDEGIRIIRKLYDDYIIQYMKGVKIKNEFEERYLHALRNRMDLSTFVGAETEAIRNLIKKEEDLTAIQIRRAQKHIAHPKEKTKEEPKEDFADRVIRENMKKIEKYPELFIHEDASIEIKKLYGTLNLLDREYWPLFDRALKSIYPSLYSGPRLLIESRMLELGRPSTTGVPPRVGSYQAQFMKFPRNYQAIDREEKQCILSAAFLLHLILSECEKALTSKDMKPEETADVEKMKEFVHTVIEDFRLKDLKENNKER